jgi:two-component system, NtrC family, response regulator HydG
MTRKILVIDDDVDICSLLQRFLNKSGFEVTCAYSAAKGIEALVDRFDLVISDYRLNDMDGKDLLMKIKEIQPHAPVIIITGYSDVKVAINVIKLGAFDYVTKPLLPDEILRTINKALESNREEAPASVPVQPMAVKPAISSASARNKLTANGEFVLGESKPMRDLYKQIELVANTNYSIIILGESGTGKELVANTIHSLSSRSKKPFVAMDCGAISKELALSELFGHEKGSFTGAFNTKIGHFEMAHGGTLFLDEVANLSYETQMALLRVIQERRIKRIGSTKEMDIDVRIIVASNENLKEASLQGRFREDLYHRLNQFSIIIPPLRERGNDVVLYATHFLEQANEELGRSITGFSPEATELMLRYSWPGNLRELKNVINRAALLTEGSEVQLIAFPQEIIYAHKFNIGNGNDDYAAAHHSIPYHEPVNYSNYTHNPVPAPASVKPNLKAAAAEAEMEAIMKVLREVNFNKTKAAQILGVDRKTLYNKLKNFKG